jgi:type IV secretion system protein VirD4
MGALRGRRIVSPKRVPEQNPDTSSDINDEVAALFVSIVVGLMGMAAAAVLLLWTAGQLSGVLVGNGWPDSSPSDCVRIGLNVVQNPGDPDRWWPPAAAVAIGPLWLVFVILGIFALPIPYLMFRLVRFALNFRRRREFRRLRLGFASGNEIRKMLSAATVIDKTKSVRPSLKGRKDINPLDVGFYLGRDIRSRQKLYSSIEDVFVILAPPRQGKDVHFCAPFTIDAPGACIVTSTRSDAFTNTYTMRAEMGKIHVFDPNGLTNWPERMRWAPMNGCADPLTAANRAAVFVNASGFEVQGDSAYWVSVSIMILRCYLHAAALGGKSMRELVDWSVQPTNMEPVRILRKAEAEGAGASGWAGQLESCVASPPDIRSKMWSSIMQVLSCFADPRVLDACSPRPGEQFDLSEFLSGRNTLYVLGKERKNGSVAPVVTAMMEDLFDSTRKIAARMPSSRLDPPLTVELNEAAHIAPMPNLPGYMGDSGGFSIALHVYLQSLSQARAKWGEHEAMIMWDNAAVRVIMGGAGNVEDLQDISRLMGKVRDKEVLSAEEVRTLKFGTAVVVARAARPVEVYLTPWWKRGDGDKIAAGKARIEELIVQYSADADAAGFGVERPSGNLTT